MFVDLSTISAGESDMEVDRVLQLQAAVKAYSGFIFELSPDSQLKDFIAAAQQLLQALKTDSNLPEKLLDSNRHLDWLKVIKEQHGSVEISSLQRVDAINATGVYLLNFSKNTFTNRFSTVEKKSSLSKDDEYQKTIGESELHELHSKLMLISKSDDGKRASDRFIGIFCSALELKKVGSQLCEAGCFLFSKMTIHIFCNPEKKVKVEINFGGDTGILKGHGTVQEELHCLNSYLQECLSQWRHRIDETRGKFPGLNYFRTKQLVQLSEEIAAALNSQKEISLACEMLIKLIGSNIQRAEILPAFQRRSQEVAQDIAMADAEVDVEDIIAKLMADYSRKVAGASIMANQNNPEFEDLVIWCEQNEDNESLIEELFSQFESARPEYEPKSCEQASNSNEDIITFDSLTKSRLSKLGVRSLIDGIKDVWGNFLKSMETVETSDFLSFERLGQGLSQLMQLTNPPHRQLHKYIQDGKPNLVVAKKDEVHLQLLHIYHHQDGTGKAPCQEEVLFLGSTTTFEDVRLMMMRSFNDTSDKIYCIVNSERLDFESTLRVEELLKMPKTNTKYRLLFISTDDRRSYIRTALNNFRRAVPELKSAQRYHGFVYKHIEHPVSSRDTTFMRLLRSGRAGMGKTLQAQRTAERLQRTFTSSHLFETEIDYAGLIKVWTASDQGNRHVFHLNISNRQTEDLTDFLFKMFILNTVLDTDGNVWVCRRDDIYLFELLNDAPVSDELASLFPSTVCMSPSEAAAVLTTNNASEELIPGQRKGDFFQVWDRLIFEGDSIQRTANYLTWNRQGFDLDRYEYVHGLTLPPKDILAILLKECPVEDPSFCELRNFASFLNLQLKMAEKSTFTNLHKFGAEWSNLRFKNFVVKFLVLMAKDFSTRSVDISDEGSDLRPTISRRRRWEESNHPYIFFNNDGATLSFLGLEVNEQCSLVDETGQVLETNIMSPQMRMQLLLQHQRDAIPIFNKDFDSLSDELKLRSLCRILGQDENMLPDPSYKITSDNIKKLLAIRTRFMCNIGVVVMGETGCGKTRMVKFLCDIMNPVGPNGTRAGENLILMKVHGGTTADMVYEKVELALQSADENERKGVGLTVLFFDEANTSRYVVLW